MLHSWRQLRAWPGSSWPRSGMLTIYHTFLTRHEPVRLIAVGLARRVPRKPADRVETLRFSSLPQIRIQTSSSHHWAPQSAADRHTELPTTELASEMRTGQLLSAAFPPASFRQWGAAVPLFSLAKRLTVPRTWRRSITLDVSATPCAFTGL